MPYIQYGTGNEAIAGWVNFDASPTLRIQKIPIIGKLIRKKLNCVFDNEVKYGDIVKGLPVLPNSVDGVFGSHVLEHLALDDFHTALDNTFKILKRGVYSVVLFLILRCLFAIIAMQFLQAQRCYKVKLLLNFVLVQSSESLKGDEISSGG